jgi:DNA-binding transcriptional regulator YhcF (GntR family)
MPFLSVLAVERSRGKGLQFEGDQVAVRVNVEERDVEAEAISNQALQSQFVVVCSLGFQVGNQVSFRELAVMTGLDKETVERYLRLLEEAFVVFRLPSFSRNLRNEIKTSRKVYFYDVGVRNAVIQQFAPLELRDDVGRLWENFLVTERTKLLSNHGISAGAYFWRTHRQQEIDYVEEREGRLTAFAFKWNPAGNVRFPRTFRTAYPEATIETVTRENYFDFIMPAESA